MAERPTLLDITRAQDPDGAIAQVAEILTETNEILLDMPWYEGNLPTGHRTTIRTGLPEPTWRMFYGGVQPTKSTRAQITDSCGMMEDYAEVDKALADLNGNTNAFRLSEDYAHIEGMSQSLAETIMYGNSALNPERFNGFAPRFNARTGAGNSDNIIHGGSSDTDNASIWLIGWGQQSVHGIYPKGSQAGLQMNDKGQVTIENVDGNNGRMEAYRTHYRQDAGLCVRDWRYVVRIANIERSALTGDLSGGADLSKLMFEAMERLPNLTGAVFYMDRSLRTKLRQQLETKIKNSTLTTANVGGVLTSMFQEIPVRRVDALATDEALVS